MPQRRTQWYKICPSQAALHSAHRDCFTSLYVLASVDDSARALQICRRPDRKRVCWESSDDTHCALASLAALDWDALSHGAGGANLLRKRKTGLLVRGVLSMWIILPMVLFWILCSAGLSVWCRGVVFG
jgi:hypothetical protein